ncbi:hypothetical protein OG394_01405 [Kribbella sp. NBC_01245]|uniref:hypothetical protein n=1 Tax=Kribbella sp. NBC_01245 TaxID=2903578 RepID=UPI002E2D6041|nr:hypothetical protein [Kribbella sp. NBC_01245]
MNDQELDRLIARANPFGDDAVRRLPTDDAESDLLEEIMITAEPTPDRKPAGRRAMVLAAAAVAAVALLTTFAVNRGNPASPAPAGPAGTTKVRTDSAERMLLNAPGWKVEDFYGGGGFDGGEVKFKNGKDRLQVHWYKAELYKSYYDDRTEVSPRKPIEILGQKGAMVTYNEGDYSSMLPPKGKYFLEIRGGAGPSEQAYRDLVAKLYAVNTDTFVDALPGTVIKPSEAEKVIDAMLSDMPVPSGLDREKLYSATPNARYHVAADVTSAVSCNWIDKWIKAKKAGDTAGMKAAVDAMNTSKSWKILKDIEKEGAWSSAIWELADALAAGKNPADYKSGIGCQ